ncbi:MAG: PhoU domain-containing protein [Phycisphaerales bacterium]|nr:hypothetical protein [Planctomycetota bacterium]
MATDPTPDPTTDQPPRPLSDQKFTYERRIINLKRRLVREASIATSMLDAAVDALLKLDVEAARAVRRQDDRVDAEEVAIEQECYEILALHHLFARDFRAITFVLKVNTDIERVADHASSIAKVCVKIAQHCDASGGAPRWPTALTELAQRVPMMCHQLLRTVLDEDVEGARSLVRADEIIDQLDKQLFEEVQEFVRSEGRTDQAMTLALYMYRLSRELERVADLMTNVAEDIVYLATGSIVRHSEKKRLRTGA